MAEASFEQARKIFEKSLEGVQATAGSMEERCANASAREVFAKALAYAEKNVQVSLDYTQVAAARRGFAPGVMRLHRDFGQSQMCSLAERQEASLPTQQRMRPSRKSKPQQGVRPGRPTNPA